MEKDFLKEEKTKISVCIATYNGEKYIKSQLESILNQTQKVDEIVISDDHSTDQTIEIIKKIKKDSKIPIYLLFNSKKGVVFNFENALKYCKGEYIFLADQDDFWFENKVEKVTEKLKEYDLVVHNAEIIGEEGEKLNEKEYFKIKNSRKGLLKNLYKNSYIGCCMAFNRKILERALPFPEDIPMHDSWIGLSTELNGKIIFIDDILFQYRRHGNNVTELKKSKNNLWQKIILRWKLIKNLLKRK